MWEMDIFTAIAKRRFDDVVRALEENPKAVNAVDIDGRTPLMLLATSWKDNDEQIIELLVRKGADVNAADYRGGDTALHLACRSLNAKFINALQDATAGLVALHYYVENFQGLTAPKLAEKSGGYETLMALARGRFGKLKTGDFDTRLAIVGVGPAGAALFISLVRNLIKEQVARQSPNLLKRIQIVLVDRNAVLGTGTPYSEEKNAPTSLLNIAAGGMSLIAEDRDHFFDWLKDKEVKGELAGILGSAFKFGLCAAKADRSAYYPRLTYGRYLAETVEAYIGYAMKHGIDVLPLPRTSVVDEKPVKDSQSRLLYLKGKSVDATIEATNVYYATGHWVEDSGTGKEPSYRDSPRYIPFPANIATLQKAGLFDEPCHIAILGSALSAIDAIYSILLHPSVGRLTRDEFGKPVYESFTGWKVTCYSRRGLLPRVRPLANEDYPLRYLNPRSFKRIQTMLNGHVSLNAVIQLLNMELSEAFGRPIDVTEEADPLQFNKSMKDNKNPFIVVARDLEKALHGDYMTDEPGYTRWYQVMHALFPVIRMIYRQFTSKERHFFDSRYNSHFLWAFAPMPHTSAEILIAMHKAGALDVRRVAPGSKPILSDKGLILSGVTPKDDLEDVCHPFLIGTTGLANIFYRDVAPLTQNLIRTGAFDLHDPMLGESSESDTSAFISDDGSFEILESSGGHSPTRRGVGFFLHAQLFDVQAVPSVVRYGAQVAEIYKEEFLYSRLGGAFYAPYRILERIDLLMKEFRKMQFKPKL